MPPYLVGTIVHYISGGDKYGRVIAANDPQYTVVRVMGPGPNALVMLPQQIENITLENIIPPLVMAPQQRRRRNTRRRVNCKKNRKSRKNRK
jgi:hypothetical protein